jgi:hypothetical protein
LDETGYRRQLEFNYPGYYAVISGTSRLLSQSTGAPATESRENSGKAAWSYRLQIPQQSSSIRLNCFSMCASTSACCVRVTQCSLAHIMFHQNAEQIHEKSITNMWTLRKESQKTNLHSRINEVKK